MADEAKTEAKPYEDPESLADMLTRTIFDSDLCSICHGSFLHKKTLCPRIKRLEFNPMGGLSALVIK
jgi:hypothetical protein